MTRKNKLFQLWATLMVFCLTTAVLIVPANAQDNAINPLKITASTVEGEAGEEVQVDISLYDNPGLSSLKFDVNYDDELTLKKVDFSQDFGTYVTAVEPFGHPQSLSFISPLAPISKNGVFATMTFQIPEKCAKEYASDIEISYEPEDILDEDLNSVPATVTNGRVSHKNTVSAVDAQFSVSDCNAVPGAEITVPVSITKNPGIAGFALDIDYDHSLLTLTKATASAELGGTFTRHEDTVTWFTNDNTTLTGTAFNLTFTVAANAEDGQTDVQLAMHEGKPNVTDENSDNVAAAFVKGTVTIRSFTPGDVTGDSDVTIADVVKVNRHVVGKITLTAAEKLAGDVTGDKDVTIADVVKINRFVVGKIKSLAVMNTVSTQEAGNAVITVGSVKAEAGEQVTVPVTLSGNPGIAGMALEFTIPDGMTLESITKGEVFKNGTFTPNGNAVTWYTTDNITENGVILNLNVTAPQTPGEYAVKAALKEGKISNLTDENSENVGASFTEGKLTVEKKAAPHTHNWDEGKVTKNSTTDMEGERTYTCTACGQTKTERIPKLVKPALPLSATKGLKVKVKKTTATITWKKNTRGKGYQIQYSTSKSFSKARTVKIKKNKIVRTTVRKLKKGVTYYFRIRTVNGKNHSDWSAVKSLKTAK